MCLGLRLHHYNLCFCLHKAFSPCVSVCQIALCLSLVRTPVIGFRVGFHLEILNYICKRHFSKIRSRSQVLRVGLGHYLGGPLSNPLEHPKQVPYLPHPGLSLATEMCVPLTSSISSLEVVAGSFR